MILPQLFLADLPPEAVLTPQLIRDACIAVKRNRAQWLVQRRTQELVELVAFAAERWLEPDSGFRRIALEQGAVETGFSPATLGRGLDALFRQLTVESLQALLTQDLGDARRLDEFAAPTAELRQGRLALARGPEMLVHIAAGNLPNSALFSLVLGILTKSAQFMKLPRHGNLIPRLFAHSLADLEPKLGSCLELAVWTGGHESLEAALFAEADCITAQGSDETLRSILPRLRPGCRWIPHGHRLSFGFVGNDQLSSYQSQRVAQKAAADIAAWNQLGCLSPHVFYVEEKGTVSAEGFAEHLAAALEERERTEPRGSLPVEIAAEIAGRRSLHELRQAHHRVTREEAKTVPRGAFFDAPQAGTRVWASPGSTDWTVVYEEDARFRTSCLNRFVYVKPCRGLEDMLRHAEVVRGQVSTLGTAVGEGRLAEMVPLLAQWGITRICPLGRMQEPPTGWRHDGRPTLGDLITWTDWETV
jgi:Acyl-CoA reductase (LuxC)